MGIQSKERYQSVSDWTASYRRFMDPAAAQRHLANVERHIAATRVIKPQNDDPSIVEPIELTNPLAHSQYARKRKGMKYPRKHRARLSTSNGAAPRDAGGRRPWLFPENPLFPIPCFRKERAHMGFVGTHSCLNVAARLPIYWLSWPPAQCRALAISARVNCCGTKIR